MQVIYWPLFIHRPNSHNQLLNGISPSGEVRTVLICSPLLISRESIMVFLKGENRPKSKGHLEKSLALDDMAIFMLSQISLHVGGGM